MSAKAIYQAGRAVIRRILGQPCGLVTILGANNDGFDEGMVDEPIRSWKRGDGSRRTLVEASCVSLYAGGEAELLITGKQIVPNGLDCSKASSLIMLVGVRGAELIGDEIWESYESMLRQRARHLVKIHRSTIERVALRLAARNTLTAKEVDALLPTKTSIKLRYATRWTRFE